MVSCLAQDWSELTTGWRTWRARSRGWPARSVLRPVLCRCLVQEPRLPARVWARWRSRRRLL